MPLVWQAVFGQALQLLEIRSLKARSNPVAAHRNRKGLEIQKELFSSHFEPPMHFEARNQRQHPLALEKASENEFDFVAKFL